ncbi:TetR/AcrR family transcriptional regulator [Paraburkholderia sp. D15]|uniref:TetR/AcrR family transcriptional regulator n=1 Tax=Paraburkholderia sp. D15 TaxID=2880218 RepID=UPI00247A3773|nr:TetR/AcrR family transcriptional regulator [Paraburkholderia sp. D15]WGS51937.1 TetR/AcrR family transcriptional regulator [Paraburkholderia sp. D15]
MATDTRTDTETETQADASSPGSARDRLLDAAEALIYAGGIHATGVDAIVKQSGTARKSFYTHFGSKDALVAAALERRDERWMNWFIAGTQQRGKTARKRLLGMFDVLRACFASEDFHGCAFLNAAGEIASAEDPIRIVAREHKERLLAFVRTQCDEFVNESSVNGTSGTSGASAINHRHAARLSRQWLVLLDGAIAVALVSGDPDAALDAQTAARAVLDAQTAGPASGAKPSTGTTAEPASRKRPPSRRTAT